MCSSDLGKTSSAASGTHNVYTFANCTDLRAGAALVTAGLLADGTTIINDAEHILRGYERIINKLSHVGAIIKIEEI